MFTTFDLPRIEANTNSHAIDTFSLNNEEVVNEIIRLHAQVTFIELHSWNNCM